MELRNMPKDLLLATLIDAEGQLRWFWQTYHACACGARAESPDTHPHVVGCPTASAVERAPTSARL